MDFEISITMNRRPDHRPLHLTPTSAAKTSCGRDQQEEDTKMEILPTAAQAEESSDAMLLQNQQPDTTDNQQAAVVYHLDDVRGNNAENVHINRIPYFPWIDFEAGVQHTIVDSDSEGEMQNSDMDSSVNNEAAHATITAHQTEPMSELACGPGPYIYNDPNDDERSIFVDFEYDDTDIVDTKTESISNEEEVEEDPGDDFSPALHEAIFDTNAIFFHTSSIQEPRTVPLT